MKRCFVSPTAEPAKLHNAKELKFAVHLAPDPRGEADTNAGRDCIEAFLATVREARFFIVTLIDDRTFSEPELLEVADLPDTEFNPFRWLEAREPGDEASQPQYWLAGDPAVPVSGPGNAGKEELLELTDASVVSAMDLLRGSLNWPAPLPQRAGLVRLVSVPAPDKPNDQRIIFPWWGDDEPPQPAITWFGEEGDDAQIDFPDLPGKLDDAVLVDLDGVQSCITRLVQPFPTIAGFGDDGWITPGWANSKTVRALRRARAQFSGLLAPLPMVLDLDLSESEDVDELKAFAAWLSSKATLALIDPLDVAFQKADRGGRLWDTLLEAFEAVSADEKLALTPRNTWAIDTQRFNLKRFKGLVGLAEVGQEVDEAEAQKKQIEPPTMEDQIRKARAEAQSAILELNEIAAELTDPEVLLRVAIGYLKDIVTGGLAAPFTGSDTMDEATKARIASKVEAAFQDYYTGPGADLLVDLREDSADFLMNRVRAEISGLPVSGQRLTDALMAQAWPKTRLTLPAPTGTNPEYAPFRPIEPPTELEERLFGVAGDGGHIGAAFRAAVDAITDPPFTADLEPQPLHIVAADGFDVEDFDNIGEYTTGIGLVIAARHPIGKASLETGAMLQNVLAASAAHANAAALRVFDDDNTILAAPIIDPSTLTQNYGQGEIALPYTGVAQIGRLVAESDPDANKPGGPLPFALAHAEYGDNFRAPPPLAYGYRYAALPYYVPNSGTLPAGIRDDQNPWKPANPSIRIMDQAEDHYLRTTAVATIPVNETVDPERRRLGFVPEDVFPIAPDLLETTDAFPDDDKPKDPPLLLLGEAGSGWLDRMSGDAELTFSAPRVGFDDFDRWVTNPFLLGELASTSGEAQEDMERIVEALSDARDYFEAAGDELFSELMNRLPDPAVQYLEVRVQVFDALIDAPKPVDATHEFKIEPYSGLTIPDPKEAKLADYRTFVNAILDALSFRMMLKSVAELAVSELKPPTNGEPLTLVMRPGDICLMTVSPLVNKAHYHADGDLETALMAINAGLNNEFAELAVSEKPGVTFCRLPGTPLLVEAMQLPQKQSLVSLPLPDDDPERQRALAVLDALKVVPDGRDRGFTYELSPTLGEEGKSQRVYRAFSEVDLITHRWRSLGQPINNWIAPALLGGNPNSPVRPLEFSDGVAAFEADAFFGRDLTDGERRRIRLPAFVEPTGKQLDKQADPEDAFTTERLNTLVLDRVRWPDQSASYWRYTQEFRSRYIGALKARNGVYPALKPVKDAPSPKTADFFVDRVAMLADISGGTITAPQLRHILPSLTPADAGGGPLPFVASLNERPFDQFGLADRVVAGVRTAQKFELTEREVPQEPEQSGGQYAEEKAPIRKRILEFDAYRKEVGPEPRRSQKAIGQGASRDVVLRTEGPVGHHFDPASADAPGFVNTSYLLHLEGIAAEDTAQTSEMFAAVELRRLVDPGWTFVPEPDTGAPLPGTWWLDLGRFAGNGLDIRHAKPKKTLSAQDAPSAVADGTFFVPVALRANGNDLVVHVHKDAAYGDDIAGGETRLTELCRLDLRREGGFLIHRSLGEDAYEIAIVRQRATDDGTRNALTAPQFVAAARFRAGAFENVLDAKNGTSFLGQIAPMLMGHTPSAMWAKSAYDLSRFCVGNAIAPLDGLVARLSGRELHFETPSGDRRRLTSRDAGAPEPLSVHTHLAALMLRQSANEGRTVLLPEEAVLLDPVGSGKLSQTHDVALASLLAFESPAEVITIGDAGGSAIATFDLDAVPEGDEEHPDILLRCRIVAIDLEKEGDLTLNAFAGNEAAAVVVKKAEWAGLSYIDLRVPRAGGTIIATGYGKDADGTTIELGDAPAPVARNTLTLSVGFPEGAVTLDVSMIPAVPRGHSAWNWDWVFPTVATGGREEAEQTQQRAKDAPPEIVVPAMAEATRAENMRHQKEAVLAPLGMTEPVALVRDK